MTSSYVEQYGGIPSSQGMLLWHHYLRWPYSQRDQIGRFLFLFGQFYLFFRQLLLEKVPNIDFDFGLYLKRRIFLLLGPLWLKYGRIYAQTILLHCSQPYSTFFNAPEKLFFVELSICMGPRDKIQIPPRAPVLPQGRLCFTTRNWPGGDFVWWPVIFTQMFHSGDCQGHDLNFC